MKKYYLVNYEICEAAYFNSDDEAFREAQQRNKHERGSNWKAYTEKGDVIYGLAICQ